MIYFISGHRDLTWEEFAKWYAPAISKVMQNDPLAAFVVGDCEGCDKMAVEYLHALGEHDITMYCLGDKRPEDVRSVVGFNSDIDRDSAMTESSDEDIAFIRKGKETSGTAQNILRRWTK